MEKEDWDAPASQPKKKRANKDEWNSTHPEKYGFEPWETDPLNYQTLSALCKFCKYYGRELGIEQKEGEPESPARRLKKRSRSRGPATTNYTVSRPFRTDKYTQHLVRCHPIRWDKYSKLTPVQKRAYFPDGDGPTVAAATAAAASAAVQRGIQDYFLEQRKQVIHSGILEASSPFAPSERKKKRNELNDKLNDTQCVKKVFSFRRKKDDGEASPSEQGRQKQQGPSSSSWWIVDVLAPDDETTLVNEIYNEAMYLEAKTKQSMVFKWPKETVAKVKEGQANLFVKVGPLHVLETDIREHKTIADLYALVPEGKGEIILERYVQDVAEGYDSEAYDQM